MRSPARPPEPAKSDGKNMSAKKKASFEDQLKRLQAIVSELEKTDIALEKSVALYKEGVELAKSCREQLKAARQEVTVLSEGFFTPFKELESEDEFGNNEDQA